jgi:hypothetical protein
VNGTTGGVLTTFIDSSTEEFGFLIEQRSLKEWSDIGFVIDEGEQVDDSVTFQRLLVMEDLVTRLYCKYKDITSILRRQENPAFTEWRCPVFRQLRVLSKSSKTLRVKSIDVELYAENNTEIIISQHACLALGTFKTRLGLCAAPLSDVSLKLAEWIGYHTRLGVEQFIMYEHFSAQKHIKLHNQLVNFVLDANLGIKHKFTLKIGATYKDASSRYQQKSALNAMLRLQELAQNHCLYTYRESFEWLLYIDVDEFVYLPRDNTEVGLRRILDSFSVNENLCALKAKNMLYSGEVTGDPGSCLVTSRYRTRKLNVVRGKRQKFFARGGRNGAAVVTVHAPLSCRKIGACGARGYGACSKVVLPLDSTILRINHYPLSQGVRMDIWNKKIKKSKSKDLLLGRDILEHGENTNSRVIDASLVEFSHQLQKCLSKCQNINISCIQKI